MATHDSDIGPVHTMLNKVTTICLVVGFMFIVGLFTSGCGKDESADNATRTQIIADKSLTETKREHKLNDLYQSEQTSPLLPVAAGIGLVGGIYLLIYLNKQANKQKAERYGEPDPPPELSKTKPPIEPAKPAKPAKAAKVVLSRQAQAAHAEMAALADLLALKVADKQEAPSITVSPDTVKDLDPSECGVSFFSSMPAPIASLVEVTVILGGTPRQVLSTLDEAKAISSGKVPLVRAFTFRGKTMPWYEFAGYDPYSHYWPAVERNWVWSSGKLTASWIGVDRLDPATPGYVGRGASTKAN